MKQPRITFGRVILTLAALGALWLGYEYFLATALRNPIWQHEFLSALDKASVVRVVEHSNEEEQGRVGHPPKVYATVTLDPGQVAKLRSLFSRITDETPTDGILKCNFTEHHYIEMVAKDGSEQTVLLCFECGQYYLGNKPDDNWDYPKLGKMSESWKSSMSEFISSLGLHPDGPWFGPDAVGGSATPTSRN